jgi:hypothetical protein
MNRKVRSLTASFTDGFRLRRKASQSAGSGGEEGSREVSPEVSRQGTRDGIHEMEEMTERGSWAQGGTR